MPMIDVYAAPGTLPDSPLFTAIAGIAASSAASWQSPSATPLRQRRPVAHELR